MSNTTASSVLTTTLAFYDDAYNSTINVTRIGEDTSDEQFRNRAIIALACVGVIMAIILIVCCWMLSHVGDGDGSNDNDDQTQSVQRVDHVTQAQTNGYVSATSRTEPVINKSQGKITVTEEVKSEVFVSAKGREISN